VKSFGERIEGIETPRDLAQRAQNFMVAARVKYSDSSLCESLVDPDSEGDGANGGTNWELIDLLRPLKGECELEYVPYDSQEGKQIFWHSSSHILGAAIERVYSEPLLCSGPAT